MDATKLWMQSQVTGSNSVDRAYTRKVVMKFMEYSARGDMKAQSLIPAICTGLGCTQEERER